VVVATAAAREVDPFARENVRPVFADGRFAGDEERSHLKGGA
jgi:hypothetical protein